MFYIEDNNKIVLFDESYGKLVDTIKFMPQYQGLEIIETDRPIIDFEFADTQEYADKKAAERETAFKKDFFEIPTYGWFRKVPKGYSSATEAMNSAFNMAVALNSLPIPQPIPAKTFIFYTQPDFYDEEQCTEEWLVAHQIFSETMNFATFATFFSTFTQAWNTQEHLNEEEGE